MRKLEDARMDLGSANCRPATAAKEFAARRKDGTATVTDNSGTETLEIRKSKNGSYYAKSSAVPGVYKLAGEIGDSFGKTAEDYRDKKLFDFGFMDPTRLEINGKRLPQGRRPLAQRLRRQFDARQRAGRGR